MGLLPFFKVFVCDQDSSVLKIARMDARLEHVRVLHDPGHFKNNFEKDLRRVLGQSKAVSGFAERLGRWMMVALKEAKKTVSFLFPELYGEDQHSALVEEFRTRMYFAKCHYFAVQCWSGCPCYFARSLAWLEECRTSALLLLPDELLLQCMQYIPRKNFFLIASTCRTFYRLSREPCFSSCRIPVRHFPSIICLLNIDVNIS